MEQLYRFLEGPLRIILSPAMDEGQGPQHGVYVGKAKDVTCPGDHEAWQHLAAVLSLCYEIRSRLIQIQEQHRATNCNQ